MFVFTVSVLSLAGCGGAGGVGHALYSKNLGKEKIIDRSDNKPNWIKKGAVFIKHGTMYAVGTLTDAPNLSMGMRVAQKRAQVVIVESLKEHLQATYSEAAEGLGIDQLDLQTMTFSSAEAVVTGFFPSDQYYEKKQSLGLGGTFYKYDCYALIEITQENYLKALDGALNGYKKKAVLSDDFRKKVDSREKDFFEKDRLINNVTEPQ
ncbi:MAG: hypothetical protein HQM16_11210 [Deltaproteobacteria bacterium]|nr:hypothetical protein [Deltaproteobacteria bacterium]